MRDLVIKGILCLGLSWGLLFAHAQQVDTTKLYQLSEVEVVERVRTATNRAGVPVQLITKENIQRLGMQDLSEAVKRFSGVAVKDYGGIGGLKTVSIRGFGAQHTAVSYDGIAITDVQSGQVDLSRFSLDNVEQISLTIGQSDEIFQTAHLFASAGVISIKTSKPVFKDKSYGFNAKLGGGSFGLFTPSFQYNQKLSPLFALSARADWVSAKSEYPFIHINGNLRTAEKRKNSDIQSLRLESNLYGELGGGQFNAKLYYYDSERGLPNSLIHYNPYAKERLWNNNFFAQAHYNKDINQQIAVQSAVRYSYNFRRYRNIDSAFPEGFEEDRNTQQEYYLSAGIRYTPVTSFSISLNSDITRNSLVNNFTNAALPVRFTSLTVLAMQYQTSRLTAVGSLLATYINDEVKNGAKPAARKRLSPAASISLRPFEESNFRIRASVKDIFRVPTFTDLYYLRMGNTALIPERALQYNVGVTWAGENSLFHYLSLSADVYYNKAEDKIVAIPTMNIWKMRNQSEVESKGFDVNLQSERIIAPEFKALLSASYSYQKAIDVTDASEPEYRQQIQYTPKHSGTASVAFENPWVNVAYSLTAVDKCYFGSQNIKINEVAGYVEHNLSLNRPFLIRGIRLNMQFELLNLTDKTYQIVAGYPMPGRSWRLNMTFNF